MDTARRALVFVFLYGVVALSAQNDPRGWREFKWGMKPAQLKQLGTLRDCGPDEGSLVKGIACLGAIDHVAIRPHLFTATLFVSETKGLVWARCSRWCAVQLIAEGLPILRTRT